MRVWEYFIAKNSTHPHPIKKKKNKKIRPSPKVIFAVAEKLVNVRLLLPSNNQQQI